MGPFIDELHPTVRNGTAELPSHLPPTVESLFKHYISSRLRTITQTEIILVPHVRDIVSSHAVWPQEPFSRSNLDLPKHVRCVTNPTIFGLGETTFGITTNDILRGISLEECTKYSPRTRTPLTVETPCSRACMTVSPTISCNKDISIHCF